MTNCTRCHKPHDTPYQQCQSCRDNDAAYHRDRNNKRINEGRCTACGNIKPIGGCPCQNEATIKYINACKAAKICVNCGTSVVDGKLRCRPCLAKAMQSNNDRAHRYRSIVLVHYGSKCFCCGEITQLVLELDHVDGGGRKRRLIQNLKSQVKFYKSIINDNFPDHYRLLCCNCNWAIWRNNGKCPGIGHKLNSGNIRLSDSLRGRTQKMIERVDGTCSYCLKPSAKSICNECFVKVAIKGQLRRFNNRVELINRYGGCCACCGETTIDFLAVDHINGGGRKQRNNMSRASYISWFKKNDYPPGFQALCHNCNKGRNRNNGFCPCDSSRHKLNPTYGKYDLSVQGCPC